MAAFRLPIISLPALLLLLVSMLQGGMAAMTFCRTPPKGASLAEPPVIVWGQETLIAFGSGFREYQGAKPGVEGPWLAPIITGLMLMIITSYILVTAPKGAPLLYYTVAFYPFATGIVEFARVNFDASRYGFLTATWHNLPEYIILFHLFLTKQKAAKAFPWILMWVWFLDVFIMFVPSFKGERGPVYGGLIEQLTGICCDHLLMYVFGYLFFTTSAEKQAPLKDAYKYGFIGSILHMLEIGPLVILLSGLVDRPFIPICVLVAFTTPITFYFYAEFCKKWVIEAKELTDAKVAIDKKPAKTLLIVGIILGLTNILGPTLLIPKCPPAPASGVPLIPTVPGVPAASSDGPTVYKSYVENIKTGGQTIFSAPGSGVVRSTTLPVLSSLDKQLIYFSIEPKAAVVPLYIDSAALLWVISGSVSALITEGNGVPQGVQTVDTGMVLALKRGVVFGIENVGTVATEAVLFIDTTPHTGHFKGTQTLFPLYGSQGPLATLTPDVLATAFNTTTTEVRALRSKYASLPFIYKPATSPRYASAVPPSVGYTWDMVEELNKGLKTPGAGGVTVGNKTVTNWPILTDLDFTPVAAYINKGSILNTHTHSGSVEINFITKGVAHFQLATPDGKLIVDQVVKQGDVVVIPPGYAHIHKTPCTDEGEHEFIATQSDLRFHTFFVTGFFSVFKPFAEPGDLPSFGKANQIGFANDFECHGASFVPTTQI